MPQDRLCCAPSVNLRALIDKPSILMQQSTRQAVWRTFADFKALHKQLSATAGFAAEFPKSRWCV